MPTPRGATHLRNLNDTGQNVTAGKAHVKKIIATNSSAAIAYLQFFDAAAANVVLGTTVPRWIVPIAATGGYADVEWFDMGDQYDTRASVFSTTTPEGLTGSASGVFLQAWIN